MPDYELCCEIASGGETPANPDERVTIVLSPQCEKWISRFISRKRNPMSAKLTKTLDDENFATRAKDYTPKKRARNGKITEPRLAPWALPRKLIKHIDTLRDIYAR